MTSPEHLSRRMRDPNFQGAVDFSLFERKSSLPRKTNWLRCPFCQNEVPKQEIFAGGEMILNQRNFEKVFLLAKETGSRFVLTKREYVKFPLVLIQDTVTRQWIEGMASYVNVDVCRKCLHKIGLRHKFNKEHDKKEKKFYQGE